jgi:hypothetical protein
MSCRLDVGDARACSTAVCLPGLLSNDEQLHDLLWHGAMIAFQKPALFGGNVPRPAGLYRSR